jgi:hypothetical protein
MRRAPTVKTSSGDIRQPYQPVDEIGCGSICWPSHEEGWWRMSLGRQRERQAYMLVSWAEIPRSPGHVFYDKLQAVLIAAGFDAFIETQCAKEYGPRRGPPSLPRAFIRYSDGG